VTGLARWQCWLRWWCTRVAMEVAAVVAAMVSELGVLVAVVVGMVVVVVARAARWRVACWRPRYFW
jgi:hypothetical protein